MYQSWKIVSELESVGAETVVPNLKEMQQQGWSLIELLKTSSSRQTCHCSCDADRLP